MPGVRWEGGVTCAFDGCDRATSRTLCDGHRQQKARGQPLTPLRPYRMTAKEARQRAALRLADADEDDEYERASDLLRKHAAPRRPENVTARRESHGRG